MGKIKFQGNRLSVALIISNPTSDKITVRSVVGEIYINGYKLGNAESFTTTEILPNAKTTLYVEVRLMALQVYKMMTDLVNKKIVLEVGFTGSVNINNKVVPMQIVDKVL